MELIKESIEILKKGLTLSEKSVKGICKAAIEIMIKEPQVISIEPPVTVCGDIHQQFYDLMQLFKIGGEIPSTKYVFLGDLVDRSYYGVETLSQLLALKVKYPERVYLLRGNHEQEQQNMTYGFYKECKRKYGGSANAWQYFKSTFDYMSLSAVISNQKRGRIFCVHGGLSPFISSLDEIQSMEKSKLSESLSGLLSSPALDLMWSDPHETEGWYKSPRGLGYLFGPDVAQQFNHKNKLDVFSLTSACHGRILLE